MEPSDVLDENGNLSIEVGKGVSRRDAMKKIGAVGAAMGTMSMAGCLNQEGGGNGNGNGNNGAAQDFEFSRHPAWAPPGWDASKTESGDGMNDRRCVFVIQNTDNQFFVPMTVGFNDALNVFGWEGGIRGPGGDGTLQDQVDIIESEIDQMDPGDVIVSTILDDATYNDAIQSALDNDIVFINGHTTPDESIWNYDLMQSEDGFNFTYEDPVSGEEGEMIIPHVGIRDERGGVAMAVEMHERLQEQKPEQDEYTVFLVNDLPDNPAVSRRIDESQSDEGTAQRYFEDLEDVSIYQDQVFEITGGPELEASRNFVVDNIQGEDIDAVVASAFWAAAGAGNAILDGELSEDILVCGFDLAGMVGEDGPIDSGAVDFTMYQDPYSQGFLNVPLAWMWVERGIEMKDLEFGVSVYDQRNIEFATQRRGEGWLALRDWQNNNYDVLI